MLLDTHCHIDLFDDPITQVEAYERSGNHCILVTMLPSHYRAALDHLRPYEHVQAALGIHPLRAREGRKELDLFKNLCSGAEYIGEIGLDLSGDGKATKKEQLEVMSNVLCHLDSGKFVSVHSRNAHEEVAILLEDSQVGPVCFHYFIGGPLAAAELANKGHYFSINHRMLKSKHREILDSIPKERILVESDGPFLTKRPLSMIRSVYTEFSKMWGIDLKQVEELIALNFDKCRTATLR